MSTANIIDTADTKMAFYVLFSTDRGKGQKAYAFSPAAGSAIKFGSDPRDLGGEEVSVSAFYAAKVAERAEDAAEAFLE